jgi:hypothetical protein
MERTPDEFAGCVDVPTLRSDFCAMELDRNRRCFCCFSMAIRAYLDGHNFDGETIRQMGIAFEMALASLRATPDCNDPIRAAFAQRIIALAQAGERDPERLCEGALREDDPAGDPAMQFEWPGRPEGGQAAET